MKPKILSLAAMLLMLGTGAASANQVFDFTGTCAFGCTGMGTGELTLSDSYTPGTSMTLADFVSFSYESSDLAPFTITNPDLAQGSAPCAAGTCNVFVTATSNFEGDFVIWAPVRALPLVSWQVCGNAFAGICDRGYDSPALTAAATAVPEPATLSLLGLGLAGLGFMRKRKSN